MVSAAISWNGATEPFFVNERGLKVNSVRYRAHLKKELFPAIKKIYKRRDWIFIQDSAPSHRAKLVQDFLKENLGRRFVKSCDWPPYSPDCNPLDYHFWDAVSQKVYEGRVFNPFKDEAELKQKIKSVWKECAQNTKIIRKAFKQFVPRLDAVAEKEGYSIKTVYG